MTPTGEGGNDEATERRAHDHGKRSPLKRTLLTVLTCLLSGPFFGSLPLIVLFALPIGLSPEDGPKSGLVVALITLVYGYALGAVPALLGGFGAAYLLRTRSTFSYGAAALLGLASGVLATVPLLLIDVPTTAEKLSDNLVIMALLAICSSIGALGTRWFLSLVRILPPATRQKAGRQA